MMSVEEDDFGSVRLPVLHCDFEHDSSTSVRGAACTLKDQGDSVTHLPRTRFVSTAYNFSCRTKKTHLARVIR